MLTITLQGEDAQEYLNYLNRQPTPTLPQPVTASISKASPVSIDSSWKTAVNARKMPESRNGRSWTDEERALLHNAANRTDRFYYSTETLAKYLGRSKNAISSEAVRQGLEVSYGLLINPNTKDQQPHGY